MKTLAYQKLSLRSLSKGFTLLEVILAVMILAVVFTFSTTLFKQQRNLNSTNNTATDILQLLQASQNYYQVNNYWPKDINALTESNNAYQGLPRCGVLFLGSSVQDTYKCGRYNGYAISFPNGYGSGAPGDTLLPKAGKMTITTATPSNTSAKVIAAQLPNANIDGSSVSATIAPAGVAQGSDLATVMAAGQMLMVKTVYTDLLGKENALKKNLPSQLGKERFLDLTLPQCPSGWTPNYEAALNQFTVNKNSTANALGGTYICKTQYQFNENDEDKTTSLTVKTRRVVANDDWFSASVMLVTYCQPPTVALPAPTWTNATQVKKLAKGEASACQFGPFTNHSGDF